MSFTIAEEDVLTEIVSSKYIEECPTPLGPKFIQMDGVSNTAAAAAVAGRERKDFTWRRKTDRMSVWQMYLYNLGQNHSLTWKKFLWLDF